MQEHLKWCAVIDFMTTENMPLINVHQQIEVVYGDKRVDITSTKKFTTAMHAGAVMLIGSWIVKGLVHSEFMPTGMTINSGIV